MIQAIVLAAALAMATPAMGAEKAATKTLEMAQPTSGGQALAPAPAAGSSKATPLHVVAECERGCGLPEDRRSLLSKLQTDPVAAFTAVLAAFTAVLAVSTVLLWLVTRAMAETSKRALLDLERPIVYGSVSKPGLKIDGTRLERSQLEISIYNHGRTLARLRRLEWEVRIAPTGSIADPIDPAKIGGRELPVGTVCVSGDPHGESENLSAKFSMEDQAAITALKLSVWVVGFVRYEDIFGRHHISGFTQAFDPIGERFMRRGGDRYNYEREERLADIPPPSSKG